MMWKQQCREITLRRDAQRQQTAGLWVVIYPAQSSISLQGSFEAQDAEASFEAQDAEAIKL